MVTPLFFIVFANVFKKIAIFINFQTEEGEEGASSWVEQARVPPANTIMFIWLGW